MVPPAASSNAPERGARRAPELRPPAATPSDAGGRAISRLGLLLIAATFAVAIAAVLWLPALVTPEQASIRPTTVTPPDADAMPAPPPAAAPAQERTAAERALQHYLKRRAEVELLGAATWAEAELAGIDEITRAGDRLFGERRFDAAAERYAEATARLDALASERPERLATALDRARTALAADDGREAAIRFAEALQIEPGLEEAERGLQRAEARSAVLERMNAGQLAELAGDLAAAEAAYRDALALDAEFARASEAVEQVASRREAQAFGAAMSNALAALDARRFDDARRALDTAAGLRPDDRAVADARRRLAATQRASELARLRNAAERQAAAEAWGEAGRLYAAARKLAPDAGFAAAGVAHAARQQRLNARIDHYLADPKRLHAPQPLAEAGRLLDEAAPALETEPRLAAKAARLAAHVEAARTPRPVTLRSDGQTEVTLFHVGRFGAFVEQRLELRPGDYTAVGARAGYRDVRVTFTVPADGQPAPVEVRCTEAL